MPSISVTESELYREISKAMNSGTLDHRVSNIIQDATKEEIHESLEKFNIKDIEQFLRTKKLNNLNK